MRISVGVFADTLIIIMPGLKARGLQTKLLITPLVSEAIILLLQCLQAYGFIRILSGTKQENTEYEKNWIWHTDFGETRHVLSGSQTLVKYARKRVYAYISRWSGNQNSLVRRIKTEFRLSLSTDKVSSLIGYHFNKRCKCCELSLFDESLLAKG